MWPVRTTLSSNTVTSSAANSVTVTYPGGSTYGTTFTATPSISIAGTSGTTALSISPWLITEFSSGISAFSGPNGITAGPDGNLWFTENGGHRIGRITPGGTVTEFSTGITANSGPLGITPGPDGNLWFTESNVNRIGRITPSGAVTEFACGTDPTGITAGPDGNLWFTELVDIPAGSGNRIGRITPSGTVTEFGTGITTRAFPFGITAGSDGNLWFTELLVGRIGRLIY